MESKPRDRKIFKVMIVSLKCYIRLKIKNKYRTQQSNAILCENINKFTHNNNIYKLFANFYFKNQ